MIALAVVLSVVVLLLAVLVAGLLRSHADILKALHDLGVGVGEPSGNGAQDTAHGPGAAQAHGPVPGPRPGPAPERTVRVPLTMGPPLPGERNSTSAPTIAGVTPEGDALAVAVDRRGQPHPAGLPVVGMRDLRRLLEAFRQPDQLGLPAGTRLVVVTKGPDMEIPAEVAAQAPAGLPVVMSTEAWGDYEVPGSPFFVLVDGRSGRRIGEGVANHFHQVAELVRRAEADARSFTVGQQQPRPRRGSRRPGQGVGQRPRADGRRHPPRRPQPLPVLAWPMCTGRSARAAAPGGATATEPTSRAG